MHQPHNLMLVHCYVTCFLCVTDLVSGDVEQLATGHDFFSSPVLSKDGNKLAW